MMVSPIQLALQIKCIIKMNVKGLRNNKRTFKSKINDKRKAFVQDSNTFDTKFETFLNLCLSIKEPIDEHNLGNNRHQP